MYRSNIYRSKIDELMVKQGWHNETLATATDTTARMISRYRCGHATPTTVSRMVRIATALKTTPNELFFEGVK